MIPLCVRIIYAAVAIVASALYGWYAVEIFLGVPAPGKLEHRKFLSWRIHQGWFNFCGSIVGWICLWILGVKWVPFAIADNYPSLSWGDVGLAFIAFIGVTGYLPSAVYTIVQTGALVLSRLTGGGEK
jgi:hypothetical protein